MRRARITIPDLAFITFSLAILGALYPVWYDGFQANLHETSTATEWLMLLILPLSILVLFSVIFVKATEGL